MHLTAEATAQGAQPWKPRMCGLRNRPLHIEVKDRLGRPGSDLRQPPPAGISGSGITVTDGAVTHGINGDVIPVGWPVALEIVEEGFPFKGKMVTFKIAQRKREPVVNSNQGWRAFRKPLQKPFGNASPRPVLAGARRWEDLRGRR